MSAGFEALFVHHGLSPLDEGWTLYAAKRLHDGATLYRDVLFVFPPGHVLTAWLGYAWEPPGIIPTRILDASLNVILCIALYGLGRRLMPPRFALLGAGLLAVAAPWGHKAHYLFGYRYLVLPVLALLAFSRWLETGRRRWLATAGTLTGVALCFRLTPAFAVGCGVAVAILASSRDWRDGLRDGLLFAAGVVAVVGPVLVWFAASVGLGTLWTEVVVRPMAMIDRQGLPYPVLAFPGDWTRQAISDWFTALQFRVYPLFYLGYGLALGAGWLRAVRDRRRFEPLLLLATVVFGAVYFVRVTGRSDIGHLESAIPPVCLLIGHFWSSSFRRLGERSPRWRAPSVQVGACWAVLAAWVFLFGSDRYLDVELRGRHMLRTTGATIGVDDEHWARILDNRIESIRELTGPEDTIFDLSASPLLHLLTDRRGIAHSGLILPATFLDTREERAVVEQLRREPPALVIAPTNPFDGMPARAVEISAPQVVLWVRHNYDVRVPGRTLLLLTPHEAGEAEPGASP